MATKTQYSWQIRLGSHSQIDDEPDAGFVIDYASPVWDKQVTRELIRRVDEAGSAIRYTRNYIVQNIVRQCLFKNNILREIIAQDMECAMIKVAVGDTALYIRVWLEVIENDDFYRILAHRVTVYDSEYFQVYDDQVYGDGYIWETTFDKPTTEE